MIHFVKNPLNPGHRHVVLAPEWSFFNWPEAGMLLWEEEHRMLLSAGGRERAPWGQREPRLFFRGNPDTDGEPNRA